jgi:hypothetical protein
MSEPDTLSLKISDLKQWQGVAWRRIADPTITPFERREIRNHMKESDEELRRCLQMMSERLRFQARAVEDVGDSFAKLKFRLLGSCEVAVEASRGRRWGREPFSLPTPKQFPSG